MIYHPLYGMNNYVLIWGDRLSCDPIRGSQDHPITPYKETLVPHLVATLIYLSQVYSCYIRGDGSPLSANHTNKNARANMHATTACEHARNSSDCPHTNAKNQREMRHISPCSEARAVMTWFACISHAKTGAKSRNKSNSFANFVVVRGIFC